MSVPFLSQKNKNNPDSKIHRSKHRNQPYLHHFIPKSEKSKHYPHSAYSVKLSKPCQYCNYGIGLIIIRYKDDKGFCKCGRCDAALYSLNENKPKQGLTHISEILDSYLPCGEVKQ